MTVFHLEPSPEQYMADHDAQPARESKFLGVGARWFFASSDARFPSLLPQE